MKTDLSSPDDIPALDGIYSERYDKSHGGHLASSGMYKNGHRTGLWTEFHTDGSTKKQCTYNREGKLHGTFKTWYSLIEGGGPKSLSHWYDNTLDGLCESYDPLAIGGEVIYSAVYSGGKLHGPVLYHNGVDTIIENYNEGVLMTRITYQTPEHLVLNPQSKTDSYAFSDSDDSDCDDTLTRTSDDCSDDVLQSSSTDISLSPRPHGYSPRDAASTEPSPRDPLSPRRCSIERVKSTDSVVKSIELLHKRVAVLRDDQ